MPSTALSLGLERSVNNQSRAPLPAPHTVGRHLSVLLTFPRALAYKADAFSILRDRQLL